MRASPKGGVLTAKPIGVEVHALVAGTRLRTSATAEATTQVVRHLLSLDVRVIEGSIGVLHIGVTIRVAIIISLAIGVLLLSGFLRATAAPGARLAGCHHTGVQRRQVAHHTLILLLRDAAKSAFVTTVD